MSVSTIDYTKDNGVMFKRPSDWVEVHEPELFAFEKIGDSLTGMLLDIRVEKIRGDEVLTMRFETPNGGQVKVRPSYDLRQKLGKRHLGRMMLLVYSSDNASTESKGNAMKVFRVFVAPESNAGEPPMVATDADLPDFLKDAS